MEMVIVVSSLERDPYVKMVVGDFSYVHVPVSLVLLANLLEVVIDSLQLALSVPGKLWP